MQQEVRELFRSLQDVSRCQLGVGAGDPLAGQAGAVKVPALPDELPDVGGPGLGRVVAPPGLVRPLRRHQLGPDALRAQAPGAVVPARGGRAADLQVKDWQVATRNRESCSRTAP